MIAEVARDESRRAMEIAGTITYMGQPMPGRRDPSRSVCKIEIADTNIKGEPDYRSRTNLFVWDEDIKKIKDAKAVKITGVYFYMDNDGIVTLRIRKDGSIKPLTEKELELEVGYREKTIELEGEKTEEPRELEKTEELQETKEETEKPKETEEEKSEMFEPRKT